MITSRRAFARALLGAAMIVSNARAVAADAPVEWTDVVLLDGTLLPANSLRGNPVIVEFWASWCPFCKRQNPVLQQLYDATRERGLRMVTFTIDIDPAKARAYLAEHRYTFPSAMAPTSAERWFGPRKGLPDLYVVDARGRIAFHEPDEMFPEDVLALARYAPR